MTLPQADPQVTDRGGRTFTVFAVLFAVVFIFRANLLPAQLLTAAERLDFLLGPGLAEIDQGPGVFEVEPSRPETLELFLRTQDLVLLQTHRREVAHRLLADLEARGSRLAALLLAWLGDRRALPELRRRLLSESDTYGWETSYPTLYAEGNHRGYHAYSRAIESLQGRPLEEAVRLSPEETASLAHRAGQADGTALILLSRLAPPVARQKVFELFRSRGDSPSCLEPGNTIHRDGLLAPGTPRAQAFELLGPPDHMQGDTALYCCGDEWAGDFRLRLDDRGAVAFESEYRDSEDREPWCPGRRRR